MIVTYHSMDSPHRKACEEEDAYQKEVFSCRIQMDHYQVPFIIISRLIYLNNSFYMPLAIKLYT